MKDKGGEKDHKNHTAYTRWSSSRSIIWKLYNVSWQAGTLTMTDSILYKKYMYTHKKKEGENKFKY